MQNRLVVKASSQSACSRINWSDHLHALQERKKFAKRNGATSGGTGSTDTGEPCPTSDLTFENLATSTRSDGGGGGGEKSGDALDFLLFKGTAPSIAPKTVDQLFGLWSAATVARGVPRLRVLYTNASNGSGSGTRGVQTVGTTSTVKSHAVDQTPPKPVVWVLQSRNESSSGNGDGNAAPANPIVVCWSTASSYVARGSGKQWASNISHVIVEVARPQHTPVEFRFKSSSAPTNKRGGDDLGWTSSGTDSDADEKAQQDEEEGETKNEDDSEVGGTSKRAQQWVEVFRDDRRTGRLFGNGGHDLGSTGLLHGCCKIEGLLPGYSYSLRATAVYGSGKVPFASSSGDPINRTSGRSQSSSTPFFIMTEPTAPSKLTACRYGKNGATLTWQDDTLQRLHLHTMAYRHLEAEPTKSDRQLQKGEQRPHVLLPQLQPTVSCRYIVQQMVQISRGSETPPQLLQAEEKQHEAGTATTITEDHDTAGWSTVRTVPSSWLPRAKSERRRRGIRTIVKTLAAGQRYIFRTIKEDPRGHRSRASNIAEVQTKRVAPPPPRLAGFRRRQAGHNVLHSTNAEPENNDHMHTIKLKAGIGRCIAPFEWAAAHGMATESEANSVPLTIGTASSNHDLRIVVFQSRQRQHWLQVKDHFAPPETSTIVAMTKGLRAPDEKVPVTGHIMTNTKLQLPFAPPPSKFSQWEKVCELIHAPSNYVAKDSKSTAVLPSSWNIAVPLQELNTRRYFCTQIEWAGVRSQLSDPVAIFSPPANPSGGPVLAAFDGFSYSLVWYSAFTGAHRYVLECFCPDQEDGRLSSKSTLGSTKKGKPGSTPRERDAAHPLHGASGHWKTVWVGTDSQAVIHASSVLLERNLVYKTPAPKKSISRPFRSSTTRKKRKSPRKGRDKGPAKSKDENRNTSKKPKVRMTKQQIAKSLQHLSKSTSSHRRRRKQTRQHVQRQADQRRPPDWAANTSTGIARDSALTQAAETVLAGTRVDGPVTPQDKRRARWVLRLIAANPDGHKSSKSLPIELPLQLSKTKQSSKSSARLRSTASIPVKTDIMVGDTLVFSERIRASEFTAALKEACQANSGPVGANSSARSFPHVQAADLSRWARSSEDGGAGGWRAWRRELCVKVVGAKWVKAGSKSDTTARGVRKQKTLSSSNKYVELEPCSC